MLVALCVFIRRPLNFATHRLTHTQVNRLPCDRAQGEIQHSLGILKRWMRALWFSQWRSRRHHSRGLSCICSGHPISLLSVSHRSLSICFHLSLACSPSLPPRPVGRWLSEPVLPPIPEIWNERWLLLLRYNWFLYLGNTGLVVLLGLCVGADGMMPLDMLEGEGTH